MSTEKMYTQGEEFCKSFTLKTGWELPNHNDMFTKPQWKLEDYQNLKTVLNSTKQKLNFFDLDQWHSHTTKMNPAGLVIKHIRHHIRPDFLTQAWCKFYEIAYGSNLIPHNINDRNIVSTVHLCEAPGAFVSSLNHYMAINHECLRLEWLAMTLNPYHESNGHPDIVSDDRLILNTLENWEFGPDYTGDIFQSGYSEHLFCTVLKKFDRNACLVTADGSIDCSDDPGEQENVVMRLHNYETMVALNVLREGGSLVLKMFTVFECNTICRMYLLCCLFKSVVVKKPITSKPGNSEVYVVCTGYLGRTLALPFIRMFFSNVQQKNAMFILSQIPCEFQVGLLECSTYFSNLQIQAIESNIDALLFKEERYCEMESLQWYVCREFIIRYGLRPIRYNQELMTRCFKSKVRINGIRRGISYAEKIRLRHLDLEQEADALYRDIVKCDEWKMPCFRGGNSKQYIIWGNSKQLSVRASDIYFRLGKPVTVVKGSKFCSESLLHYRLRVLSKFPQVENTIDMDSRSFYYRFKLERPDLTVCDLTEICAQYRMDNVDQQYYCLKAMLLALQQVKKDFLLIGFPLYTQMSVACFFAVASMFETYGLLKPDHQYGHAFVFLKYKKHEGWFNALSKANDFLLPAANKDLALVSWVPIRVLLEQKIYADIVTINNLCIIHEIEPILSSFLNSVS
ncbi:cap-specific mRNA (nucleoside-2'-O-)-methyltransferase 2-like [Sipha flava]|uniref:Cap-specific mRNA (nucleoside-2'-O-)-methyltransferase 2 n=1 Tax=Sipha flava TaxID=143950 RepID=A0A8B8G7H4_9HEMI|nr:cap-specific mRNA (nucleoside-2'-O-)-methyltransferase 2-like [Sipha flava]XP_025419174.1 cap-specific mRNA (nucleoside-2'-O-)-methyltransferase 2-like [Sipha flava]